MHPPTGAWERVWILISIAPVKVLPVFYEAIHVHSLSITEIPAPAAETDALNTCLRSHSAANESVQSITVAPILGLTSIYRLRNYIRGVPTNSDTSSFRHESPIHKRVSKNKSYLPELNSTCSGENVSLKTKQQEKRHVSKRALKPSACRSPCFVRSR